MYLSGTTQSSQTTQILRPQVILLLKQIIEDGQIISYNNLAKKCNILPINAGRIAAGLKRNIKVEYINETREGPPNHPVNSITIEDKINDVTIDLSKMNVKTVYNKLIDNNYSPPRVENFFKQFFLYTDTQLESYLEQRGE